VSTNLTQTTSVRFIYIAAPNPPIWCSTQVSQSSSLRLGRLNHSGSRTCPFSYNDGCNTILSSGRHSNNMQYSALPEDWGLLSAKDFHHIFSKWPIVRHSMTGFVKSSSLHGTPSVPDPHTMWWLFKGFVPSSGSLPRACGTVEVFGALRRDKLRSPWLGFCVQGVLTCWATNQVPHSTPCAFPPSS